MILFIISWKFLIRSYDKTLDDRFQIIYFSPSACQILVLAKFCQHLLRFYFHVYCCGSLSDHLSGSWLIPSIKFSNFQPLLKSYFCSFFLLFFVFQDFSVLFYLMLSQWSLWVYYYLGNICKYNNFYHFAFKFADVTCSSLSSLSPFHKHPISVMICFGSKISFDYI